MYRYPAEESEWTEGIPGEVANGQSLIPVLRVFEALFILEPGGQSGTDSNLEASNVDAWSGAR